MRMPSPLAPRAARTRAGFTLIELLVVIAIIAVLVSLISAAVFYAFFFMSDTTARSEIAGLDQAVQAFKGKYGCYPPSQLRLCTNASDYTNPKNPKNPSPASYGGAQFDLDSLAFISRVWPNIGAFSNINWAGNGNAVDEILEGDQVLVFFIGGIPSPSGGSFTFTGFATGKDPSATGNVGRNGPFYTFPSARMFLRRGSNFPSFKDAYKQQPYLYFSSNNRRGGYNPYLPSVFIQPTNLSNTTGGGTASVMAYYQVAQTPSPLFPKASQSPGQYVNADNWQILCAGRDGNFNSFSSAFPNAFQWNAANPAANLSPAGMDDLTNFTGGQLKTGQ